MKLLLPNLLHLDRVKAPRLRDRLKGSIGLILPLSRSLNPGSFHAGRSGNKFGRSNFNWKPLILCHLAIALLLGSLPFWGPLDHAIFKSLNHTLEGHPWVQVFWAFVNHRKADLVEDVVFLLFFIAAIKAAPQGQRIRRTAQFIFCILLAGSIIYFVNRGLLREHVLIPRESPSLVLPCIKLSEEIPWMKIKDETIASFPGDHATTLLLFVSLYTFFAGRKLGFYAALYVLLRLLPRLIVGAHWVSDIAVGSVSLVLFFLSWALCTPFRTWIIDRIERFLLLFKRDEVEKESV